MARPAPGTERTVALITFLADHSGRSFSLSELARRLQLNKATAHATLAALNDARWVVRDPMDGSYRLGPAVVSLGHAASAGGDALEVAWQHMRVLSEELHVQAIASKVIGEDMVMLAVEGRARPFEPNLQPGQLVRLAPPLGTVFVAWADDETVNRWLARLGPDVDERVLQAYRRALAAVRRRGYAAGLGDVPPMPITVAPSRRARTAANGVRGQVEMEDGYLLLDLERAPFYQLAMISAPVFGVDGNVVLALTLTGFKDRLSADEVPACAKRLVQSADAITAAINGLHPPKEVGGRIRSLADAD